MSYQNDLNNVRELAKKYAEIANSERHIKMRRRFRDTNDLKVVRPPLNIEEIPWQQMNFEHELDCTCEDGGLRGIEYSFRVALFREKYFKSDNYIEPCWVVYKSFSDTGFGFAVKENCLASGAKTDIISHHYEDVLADEADLEKYHDPVITPYPENDRNNVAAMEEILDGILPVELRGHTIYYSPWDEISMLRGVENILIDVYERPEHLHKIISLFTRGMNSRMNQMEENGLYDSRAIALHCTPNAVTIPNPSPEGNRCRDIWFRTMAQMFSSISPDAHYEFDVQYSVPLAERCAYTYYGCCEPLDDRIHILKNYKNLRKIGVSPWADVWKSAEQIGKNYVLSRKPNPANVAIKTDPEVIRAEITETVKACQKFGCPCDITLKDISTVGNRPENLFVWAKTASEVLDEYYGKE